MCFVKTAVLKMRTPLSTRSQWPVSVSALEPGHAWEMTPASVWSPQVADSVADAAPSACAISERRSGT